MVTVWVVAPSAAHAEGESERSVARSRTTPDPVVSVLMLILLAGGRGTDQVDGDRLIVEMSSVPDGCTT
jgi:hypothetical protein